MYKDNNLVPVIKIPELYGSTDQTMFIKNVLHSNIHVYNYTMTMIFIFVSSVF